MFFFFFFFFFFLSSVDFFFLIHFRQKMFQEWHQSVKQFGSGSKLFAKVISRRQKSPLGGGGGGGIVKSR